RSPTFGKPLVYRVTPSRVDTTGSRTIQDVPPVQAPFDVHASHCIHVAREADEDGIFGIPYYVPIWNDLIDLMKVVGSSAESYWRTAYQGLHADVDKELDMDPDDEKNLSEELDEYQHNLRRTIRTRGVTVKSLGAAVADPSGAFNTLLTMIAGSTGIPKRILVGSEAGQLASTQDRGNWAERVEDYRTTHAVPNILWPLLRWLNEYEVYTMDVNAIKLLWPSAYRQSPMEQAQTGAQTARTLANVQKGLQPIILEE
ncbi:anti-CBASS protein Acb1 family protein, partial [Parvimonas sp. D9]